MQSERDREKRFLALLRKTETQPGQSFANPDEIEQATRVATAQLNRRASPWIWGRPRHPIIATIAASFLIAFKERSNRSCRRTALLLPPARHTAQGCER